MKQKIIFTAWLLPFLLCACWKPVTGDPGEPVNGEKVWGYKPIYGTESEAKTIAYTAGAKKVVIAGNIYAYQDYLFQMDVGLGIHVIDNHKPAAAARIGFINVKGCSQISIKGGKLYTNSYDDLVVLELSDLANIKEYSRLKGVFTEYRYDSPISRPPGSGFYQCPSYQAFVVGWTRDSVYKACYQN